MRQAIVYMPIVLLLAACSLLPGGADGGASTPLGPTPTATPRPPAGLPDSPLLDLRPVSGVSVSTSGVLVEGTVEAGARVRVNSVETETDQAGDFLVAVALVVGENRIGVEVTGIDGARATRELFVTRTQP